MIKPCTQSFVEGFCTHHLGARTEVPTGQRRLEIATVFVVIRNRCGEAYARVRKCITRKPTGGTVSHDADASAINEPPGCEMRDHLFKGFDLLSSDLEQ